MICKNQKHFHEISYALSDKIMHFTGSRVDSGIDNIIELYFREKFYKIKRFKHVQVFFFI